MTRVSPNRLHRAMVLRTRKTMRRRDVLVALGGLSAASVLGCATGGTQGASSTSSSSSSSSSSSGGSSSVSAASSTQGSSSAGPSSWGGVVPWALGGTAMLAGKDYGNPFANGVGPTCVVFPDSTLGPCHAITLDRQDISEGQPGLPTRLEFLLVDGACNPLPNATLEVWHCSVDGYYSGNDVIPFCTSNNPGAIAARYFRGIRTADANGRVTFDTCFPGWYPGRTVHIHFTVVHNGVATKTSQVFFEDALKADVQANHPTYVPRGAEDTSNTTDGVIRQAGLPIQDVAMATARQADGALLAWKAIVVR